VTIEIISEALGDRNFSPCDPVKSGAYCFAGNILCNGEQVPIEFELRDLDFISPPIIRVLKRPKKLEGFQPHFGVNDELCYINKGMVYLDRYNPEGVVYGCLDKASEVLSNLASKNPDNDTHDEFASYWNGNYLYIDTSDSYEGVISVVIAETVHGKKTLLAGENPLKRVQQLENIGWKSNKVLQEGGYIFLSSVSPAVTGANWPPKTLDQALNWIKSNDEELYKKVYRQFTCQWFTKTNTVFLVFRTPGGDFGFRFKLDKKLKEKLGKKPKYFRNYLINHGSYFKIERLVGFRFDQNYIHSRNLIDNKNFCNKRILLAGCGTIGGYLATYLARLGAGLGNKGRLIVCDPEDLNPENVGRHVLGMYALLGNKSQAVKNLILNEFPHLNIDSRPVDVREVKELYNVDIVIDATGEEGFSIALNEIFTQRRLAGNKIPDVLHVWTGGAGEVAQALMVDSLKTACYSCLYIRHPNGEVTERYPTTKAGDESNKYKRVGCDSFMPFPVSASVQTASLAIDMMLDWIRDISSPRFRTKVLNIKNSIILKDQDAPPLKNCPACQKK